MRLIWNLIKICAILCLVAMIFALFKVLFDFLASYGLWILLFVVVLVFAYCLYEERDRFKRKPKPTMTIAALDEEEPALEITTEQANKERDCLNSTQKPTATIAAPKKKKPASGITTEQANKECDCLNSTQKPTMTIATLNEKKPALEITTTQDYQKFLNSHSLIRSFITKVVGVTYPNDDGTDRQEILSMCVSGEPVAFYWHTFRGAPACAVITDHGQIGYLSADLAADLDRDYNGDEYIFEGHISDILGGEEGLNYGCYIMLSIYGPDE